MKAMGYAANHPFSKLKPLAFDCADFCAKHNVSLEIEMIDIQDVNTAFKKVKEDVRLRYVIDMASLKREMVEAA